MDNEVSLLETFRSMFANVDNIAITQKRDNAPIWITGETKPIADVLKELGFQWSRKRMAWYLKLD